MSLEKSVVTNLWIISKIIQVTAENNLLNFDWLQPKVKHTFCLVCDCVWNLPWHFIFDSTFAFWSVWPGLKHMILACWLASYRVVHVVLYDALPCLNCEGYHTCNILYVCTVKDKLLSKAVGETSPEDIDWRKVMPDSVRIGGRITLTLILWKVLGLRRWV